MQIKDIGAFHGKSMPILIITGFGAFRTLQEEDGLHVIRDARPVSMLSAVQFTCVAGAAECQVIAIIGVIVLIGWPIMMSDFALTRAY
jgi:hypothetical protein